ncbi:HLH DNA binding protein [Histoplasma capsulatum H143]|uniref:HLH DNA binding protein n=1 Tax=Ajellomyces capsulatus (strain H143) TaxID=544712 RepID=C6HSY1_AJECH|nr:HLH DNA binding protein [Histoplasma capsulatum H143]
MGAPATISPPGPAVFPRSQRTMSLLQHCLSGGVLCAADSEGYDTHGLPANTTELSQIDQQLLQHVGNQNGVSDDNAMTAKAALAAHSPQSKYPPPDPSFENNAAMAHGLTFPEDVNQVPMTNVHGHSTAAAVYAAREAQNINPKPTSNAAAAKQSTKASTRSPRWSPVARKPRAPSCSAPSITSTSYKMRPKTWLRAGTRPT